MLSEVSCAGLYFNLMPNLITMLIILKFRFHIRINYLCSDYVNPARGGIKHIVISDFHYQNEYGGPLITG